MSVSFIPMREADLSIVKAINDWYILNSTATYYLEPITFEQLKEVIYFNHPKYKSYLIYDDEIVVGYCYLTSYKKRPAYDRTAARNSGGHEAPPDRDQRSDHLERSSARR